MINRKKYIIISFITVFSISAVGAIIIWYYNTIWERSFDIQYIGYEQADNIFHKSDYYHYQITNTTNITYTDLYATICVEADSSLLTYIGFSYNGEMVHIIRPGETVDYEIYLSDINDYAKANNYGFSSFSSDIYISKLNYK